MMSKVLVSFASGNNFIDLLKVALPSFYNYGIKQNYDIIIPSYNNVIDICNKYNWDYNRPISWLKIPIIKSLLEKYDTVLWVDSDVIITQSDYDIAENFDDKYSQGFVVHKTVEGNIPNMGIWLLNKNAQDLLDNIWQQNQFINHCWWEQKANMCVMNWNQYDHEQNKLTTYGIKSLQLAYEWNVHKNDVRYNENISGRFLHATMWPDRLKIMKEWSCQIS